MAKRAAKKPAPNPLAEIRGLSALMRAENIVSLKLDPKSGKPLEMTLHPQAFLIEEKRRQEAEAQRRREKRAENGLPVEPQNPLRDELEKGRAREMLDGVEIGDDDPDMYAHTGGGDLDAFSPGDQP